jgi:hypothetical protein
MWTPELVMAYLLNKIQTMINAQGLTKESAEKSLRKYETKVHPLLIERLQIHGIMSNDNDTLTTTSSYQFYSTGQGLRGNRLMNYIFQSLFDQEEPEWNNILYVNASKKTKEVNISEGLIMDDAIKQKVLSMVGGDLYKPVLFRHFAASLLGSDVVENLLHNPLADTLIGQHIERFLQDNNCKFPAGKFVTIPHRKVSADLVMTTKYYPGRDDFRAYCRDTNMLRHLCGICLHILFMPTSIGMRKNLEREQVIPALDKDLLSISLPYPYRHEVALLILGDVSNFTGSLGNSWLMLFCMALELCRGGTWEKQPNLYSVKGALISATWYELIVMYLYLNVGYPAFVEDLNEYHYLPGGFLGIAANITIGLVFLSVVLQNSLQLLRVTCRVAYAQAGGDDFAFGIVVADEDKEHAVSLIKEHIENYVGHLKEYHVIDLGNVSDGKLGNYTFCKKWINVRRMQNKISLQGQDNVPILNELLPNNRFREREVLERWSSYDRTLTLWEKQYGCPNQIDSMRVLFARTYPSILPLARRRLITSLPLELETIKEGNKYYTKKALTIVHKVPDVNICLNTYLGELSDKTHHCLKCNLLTLRKVEWLGFNVTLVLHKNEVQLLERKISLESVGLDDDKFLTDALLDLIK